MKALVTGVAGFIGSSIARRLLADDWTVVGIDSLTNYYDPALKARNLVSLQSENFRHAHGDLADIDLDAALDGVEYVFHQAGQPGVRKSWGRDFVDYTSANVNATQRLLEAAQGSSSIKKIVNASSSSVYGNAARYPVLETDLPRPLSPYGVTKLAAEHLCSLYAANFGVPVVSLRYFTVYGPRQRPDMAFTRFVEAALTGGEISIYGDGKQIRDFTFVEDIVTANILAATSSTCTSGVFNVAGGSMISVNETLDLLSSIAGVPLNVKYIDAVPGDVARTGGSTESFHEAVGWQPAVTIEDGLARQFSWGQQVWAQTPAIGKLA